MRSVREDEQSEANPLFPGPLALEKKRHEPLSDRWSQLWVTSSRGACELGLALPAPMQLVDNETVSSFVCVLLYQI